MLDKTFELYGFIQGDGDLGRLRSPSHKGLEINIGKNDLDICEYFNIEYPKDRTIYYTHDNIIDKLKKLEFSDKSLPTRCFPKTFNKWSSIKKTSFIRGLYTANGCFIKAGRISFKTTCFDLSVELTNYLKTMGFHPYTTTNKSKFVEFSNGKYLCKQSYDINIGRQSEINMFYNNIGFIQKYKMENIKNYLVRKGLINEQV